MDSAEVDYEQTVQYLFSQLPMFQRDGNSAYKKDLSNTVRLCEFLGNPQHQFKSIHVAGTNGKGSSSHYLASICQEAGYKTGLYTSPHLKSFTERIKINGVEIEREFVVSFVNRIKPLIDDIQPSFFEITVAMCFDFFAYQKVDIAVIEVGMGGRLDSTNLVLPEVSLITNISLDHQQWLGETIEEIAKEKAGIIKNRRPVVISETQVGSRSVFNEVAKRCQSTVYFADDEYEISYSNGFHVKRGKEKLMDLSYSVGPAYQLHNLKGVLKVVDILNDRGFTISKEQMKSGLEASQAKTGLKGRWQQLGSDPHTFCDVGHNEAGIDLVLEQIANYTYDQLHFVLGVVDDKEIDTILEKLPKTAVYYFCQAKIPRALDAKILQQKAANHNLKGLVVHDVNEAISLAKKKAYGRDFIFIGGSNFVVAEINNL